MRSNLSTLKRQGLTAITCASPKQMSLVSAAGVAGGATRAALTQHFSQGRNNAADISAKEGSQVFLPVPVALPAHSLHKGASAGTYAKSCTEAFFEVQAPAPC